MISARLHPSRLILTTTSFTSGEYLRKTITDVADVRLGAVGGRGKVNGLAKKQKGKNLDEKGSLRNDG